MVYILKASGFRCSVEEAVFSSNREGYAHVLSLVGTRESVKAIWARLMKGEAAYLYAGSETRVVRMNSWEGGKLLTERLPSGAFHGLLLSQALLRGEVLVCEKEEDLPGRSYNILAQKLRLPLHEAWQGWLWDHAHSKGMVKKLASQRLFAYEVHLSVYDLEQAVREALVRGELPEIEVRDAA